MYISAISPVNQYKPIYRTENFSAKLNVLSRDEVSFSGRVPLEKFEKTLYRAVDKAEVDALLRGEHTGCYKYATSDPRGWGAKNWISGFAAGRKNAYFIQFKENCFDNFRVFEAFDDPGDTRYILPNGYELSDIHSIHEGTNAHGKIIWASSDDIIEDDLKEKITGIFGVLKRIIGKKTNEVREDVFELTSYAKEFPTIAEPLLKRAAADKNFAYELMIFFDKSESDIYYPFVKNYIKSFSDDVDSCAINEYAVMYLGKHGSSKDIDLLFDVMKKDPYRISHGYPFSISRLIAPKDYHRLFELYNSANYGVKDIVICTANRLEKVAKLPYETTYNLCIKTLKDMRNILPADFKKDPSKIDLLSTCSEILFRHAEKEDIPLLKHYSNLGVYTDGDFKAIIRDLES